MFLVTGASGFLGSYIVSEARRVGRPVRGMIRPTSYRGSLNIEDDHIVYGDLTDVDSLVAAMAGCDAVVHCAAVISETAPDENLSLQVNVVGTENLIQACRLSGVRRLVHISAHSASETNTSVYGRTKREADTRIQGSDLDWTILKPAIIYGPGGKGLFVKITRLVNKLPVIPVIGPGNEELRPIFVHDLTEAVFSCLDKTATVGRIYDLGGQDTVTFNAFVQAILEAQAKKSKKLMHIPLWLCHVMARSMALVMPNPPITVDNLVGLRESRSFSTKLAEQDFGFAPLALDEGLKETFRRTQRRYQPGENPCKQIAIVGLGKMGILHASMISMIPNASVAALVDLDTGQGKSLRSMGIQAPFFTDLQEAIERVELDGVMICTPQFAHRSVAEVAVRAGLHVFCEKPLAHTLGDAESMVDLVNGQPTIKHAMGYMMGHLPTYRRAHELLDARALGQLQGVEATCYLSQVFRPSKAWFYKKDLSGGGLVINVASHLIALLYFLFGKAECVEAEARSVHSTEVEDEARAILRSQAGFDMTVKTSWSVPGYPLQHCSIAITGENGTLRVDDKRLVVDLHTAVAGLQRGTTTIHHAALESAPFNVSPDYAGEAYYREDAEFIAAMGNGRRPSITWHDGLAVQEIIEQFYAVSGGHRS
jgi:predicted dehydrogenase/nucleoside-diphosphate-sugar epimerase